MPQQDDLTWLATRPDNLEPYQPMFSVQSLALLDPEWTKTKPKKTKWGAYVSLSSSHHKRIINSLLKQHALNQYVE